MRGSAGRAWICDRARTIGLIAVKDEVGDLGCGRHRLGHHEAGTRPWAHSRGRGEEREKEWAWQSGGVQERIAPWPLDDALAVGAPKVGDNCRGLVECDIGGAVVKEWKEDSAALGYFRLVFGGSGEGALASEGLSRARLDANPQAKNAQRLPHMPAVGTRLVFPQHEIGRRR